MKKIEMIKKILKNSNKNILKSKKNTISSLDKLRSIPDDEYSLNGDAEQGRNSKAEVIESYQYHIGYANAHNALVEHILSLLDMTEDEINTSLIEDKKIQKKNSFNMKNLMKGILTKAEDKIDRDSHIEWCSAHGTELPWATDTTCDCPGAYIIRKRMSEGMSFEDAKQWVIDNEQF